MKNGESVGIASIAIGVLLVIGAVRGTWKKLFQDVVLNQSSGNTTQTTDNSAALASRETGPSNPTPDTGNFNPGVNYPLLVPPTQPPVSGYVYRIAL